MTDRELMQMALQNIQNSIGITKEEWKPRASIMDQLLRDRLAQPEREWFGLTDNEITLVIHEWRHQEEKPYQLCKAIEAKLKEKNT